MDISSVGFLESSVWRQFSEAQLVSVKSTRLYRDSNNGIIN